MPKSKPTKPEDDPGKPPSKPRNDEEFLELAHERFRACEDAEDENRKLALDDLKFSVGENQWPADIKQKRIEEGKPALTMNRIPQFIFQVTNEQRQQRPAIHVNPVGDGADKETAKIFQGMIRHIEVASESEVADDMAFDAMIRTGFGAISLLTQFIDMVNAENLDQEILIEPVKNAFRFYWDPNCQKPDYSDAKYAFKICPMSTREYNAKYPKSKLAKFSTRADFNSIGGSAKDWATKDEKRVAEYFYVEEDWQTVTLKGGRLRKICNRKVKWAKINAIEILEETDWPGQYIPWVPVLGTDLDIDGKRYLAGLVRNAKDPQRAYNFGISTAWQVAGIAPKAPYIAAFGQIEDFLKFWEQANRRDFPYLPYKHIEGVEPPQRQSVEPPIEAFAALVKQADYDLKASTGLFDPSLGQNKSDQSGKAIQSLQKQGDLATLNYSDNLARSKRHEGRILVDLIPHIYDAPRVQRIVHPDSSVEHVGVFNSKKSGMSMDQVKALAEMANVKKIYDLGVGKYDVTVAVGPSYQTKRQEAVEAIMTLVNAYPQLMQAAGDILIRNMDWPGAEEIADRLQKLLPPELQPEGDDPKAVAMQAQSKLNALMQQHQMVVAELQKAQEILNGKQLENQTKLEIAKINGQVALLVQEAKTQGEGALIKLQEEIKLLGSSVGLIHDNIKSQQDRAHQAAMSASSQAGQSAEAERARTHQTEMAKQAADQAAQQQQELPDQPPNIA